MPFRLTRNLTFLGPPGSGKGFYGKPIAEAWDVPLLTASTILRQHAQELLDSGELVDCQVVTTILGEYLEQQYAKQNFVLDGFPRTIKQIELMHSTWPLALQVTAAIQLKIPDAVCREKMLGRRHCTQCDRGFNIANVQSDGFDLPPQLPAGNCCSEPRPWIQRRDDTADIIDRRLEIYREHERPIINYFRDQERLLALTPYRGDKDLPVLQRQTEEWLQELPA